MFSVKYFIHDQREGGNIRCTEKGHMSLFQHAMDENTLTCIQVSPLFSKVEASE
jgi:hypothetical protein